jgi:hypothetical protein
MPAGRPLCRQSRTALGAPHRLSGLSVFLLSQRRIFVIFAREGFVFFAFILL